GVSDTRPGVSKTHPGVADTRPGVSKTHPGVANTRSGVSSTRLVEGLDPNQYHFY
ncbi:hypothetical protein T484DRAFT_1611598, partial [Baffinella frigidus]